MSEATTILIHFHQSHYRNFKANSCEHVVSHLPQKVPGLVRYTRFVDFIPFALFQLRAYFRKTCLDDCSGVSFIDSTFLDLCLHQRIASHKVFASLAGRVKTSTGWFFGFKLHLVINDRGELLNVMLKPGDVDDSQFPS